MFKKISKFLVTLTLLFTLSVSAFACDTPEEEEGAYAEYIPIEYQGIHELYNEYSQDDDDTYLVKEGVSSFAIVMPAIQNDTYKLAKEEFNILLEKATGVSLPVYTVSSQADLDAYNITPDGSYISLGSNALWNSILVDDSDPSYDPTIHITPDEYLRTDLKEGEWGALKQEGYRMITKKNVIYINGNTENAILNGVYGFIKLHFNFEQYYQNCMYIDEGVMNEKMKNFNVTDVPDIDRRTTSLGWTAYGDARYADLAGGLTAHDIKYASRRMRMSGGHYSDLLPVLYQEGWWYGGAGYIHNCMEYFPDKKNIVLSGRDGKYNPFSYEYICESTLYVNYDKYFYDEFDLLGADNPLDYEKGTPKHEVYINSVDNGGKITVDGDADGDGIPDAWKDEAHEQDGIRGDYGLWMRGIAICFNAGGNDNALRALERRIADSVIRSLIVSPVAEYPYRNTMLFSMEDATGSCHDCAACKQDYIDNYGSYNAAVNKLLNNVWDKYVGPWMNMQDEEGNYIHEAYRRPNLVLSRFIYHDLVPAPVETVYNEDGSVKEFNYDPAVVCNEHVGGYIAQIDAVCNTSFFSKANASSYENLLEWKQICSNFWFWTYPTMLAKCYFYDSISTYNGDYMKLISSMGAAYLFNEMQDGGDEATGFQSYTGYILSRLMWDSNTDVGEATQNYFDNMYLEASDIMLKLHTSMRVHRNWMADYYDNRNIGMDGNTLNQVKFYPMSVLVNWNNQFDEAMKAVEKYKATSPDFYNLLCDRIEIEKVATCFIACKLYADQLSAEQYNDYKLTLLNVTSRYPLLSSSYSDSPIRAFALTL